MDEQVDGSPSQDWKGIASAWAVTPEPNVRHLENPGRTVQERVSCTSDKSRTRQRHACREGDTLRLNPARWVWLILTLAVSACGNEQPPTHPTDTVASILLGGASAEPLRVGETLQLTATPRDAAGNTVNRPVSWASSNNEVAAVSAQGLVTAVKPGDAVISASSERSTATVVVRVAEAPAPDTSVASILLGGAPTEPLPANETVQLTATPRDADGNPLSRPVRWTSSDSEVAEVNAEGLVTAVKPGDVAISASSERSTASVVVRVTVARVATVTLDGVPTGQVAVGTTVQLSATPKDSRGTPLPERTVNWSSSDTTRAQVSATGLVTALKAGQVTVTATSETKSASATLELYVPVAQISVSPSSAVIAIGRELQLQAVLKDAQGNVLTGRTVTWVSSDMSRAEVQSNGKVTGRSEGTATITATCEGKSATAQLRVITTTGSWNQTEDWATYQGNARHTGAVDATLDPAVFRELWVRQVFTGSAALNPVTEGNGRVFVSTQSYFGSQQLTTLDAQTGAPLWTYDFGAIHGAHPPAYSDGRVYLTTSGHQDSFLYAFDAADGSLQFKSAYGNQWSTYYAPVVSDGSVFMAGGYYDGMYSFNATSGKQQWFSYTTQYNAWTPAVAGGQVFAYTEAQLQVVDALTGTVAYKIDDPGFSWAGWSMNMAPVLGGAQNVLARQYNRLLSFDLENRRIAWTLKDSFTGNVTVADGVLYVFNKGKVEARAESNGDLLWTWTPPTGTPQGTMVVTDNMLFVSTATNTYAVDLTTRAHVWTYPAGGYLALGKDGILFIARSNGSLSAITVK
ncbi:hypothetical protein D7Y23_22460 [Corallococcus sp. AB050B]|nr:hypothetical protein D7Y23_22460 [Corallococcus sp. AB050B]